MVRNLTFKFRNVAVLSLSMMMVICLVAPSPVSATEDDSYIELSELVEEDPNGVFETPYYHGNNDSDASDTDLDDENMQQYSIDPKIAIEIVTKILGYAGSRIWEVIKNTNVSNGWVSESRIFTDVAWGYKSNGKWAIGWKLIDDEWFFFNSSGYMFDSRYHNRFQFIGNYTYEFKPSGPIYKNSGWKVAGSRGDEWAYWVPGHYGAVRNGWKLIDEKFYNFNNLGYVWKNEGWKIVDGRWMYFVPGNYGAYRNTTVKINGSSYSFDYSGYCYAGNGC